MKILIIGSEIHIKDLEIAENGAVAWLREFGYVKVFRTHLKNQVRHYAIYLPKNNDDTNDENDALNHLFLAWSI